jgi:predicted ArsR family transcriptional regulator
LDLFRSVLGHGVDVERTEHIVGGDRRCAYRVIDQR